VWVIERVGGGTNLKHSFMKREVKRLWYWGQKLKGAQQFPRPANRKDLQNWFDKLWEGGRTYLWVGGGEQNGVHSGIGSF